MRAGQEAFYKHLHQHPELAHQEHQTARRAAERLREAGTAVTLAVPVADSGMAAAYAQRQFRADGADTAMVGLALLDAGVVSTVAFAVISVTGAMLSGSPAAGRLDD